MWRLLRTRFIRIFVFIYKKWSFKCVLCVQMRVKYGADSCISAFHYHNLLSRKNENTPTKMKCEMVHGHQLALPNSDAKWITVECKRIFIVHFVGVADFVNSVRLYEICTEMRPEIIQVRLANCLTFLLKCFLWFLWFDIMQYCI